MSMTVPGILAPGVTVLDVCDAISRCVGDAFDTDGAQLNGVVKVRPCYEQRGYSSWQVHIKPRRAAVLATARIRDGERVLLTFDFGGHVMAEADVIDLDVVIRGEPG